LRSHVVHSRSTNGLGLNRLHFQIDFRCGRCSELHAADPLVWRCPKCQGPLDLAAVEDLVTRTGQWVGKGEGLWRFADWLPVSPPLSLGEPITPLLTIDWSGRRVTLKLESALPTGSFKDRGAAVLVGWLRSVGVSRVAEDSSGNAGASIAAYCARAGISCEIYVPAETSPGKLAQISAYGATLRLIPGPRQAAAEAAANAVRQGTAYASHIWNPYFMAGTQTFAFELWEQLGRRSPDALLMPVGAGTLFLGCWLGFEALQQRGLVNRTPRLLGVQSTSCAPLARAFAGGLGKAVTVTPRPSIAEGISIADPPRAPAILRAARDSGGHIAAVEDRAIAAAVQRLGGAGTFVEPTAAAAFAGLEMLFDSGILSEDEEVVVAVTGTGLKGGAARI
jgi:threonine synthase